jgi:adenylate cyclase 8
MRVMQYLFNSFLQQLKEATITTTPDATCDKTDLDLSCNSLSATEEVDELIDQNIQINSNKQMREEYLNSWSLRFKDSSQETNFCQLREDMFRSNMLCMFILWVFIVLCQLVKIPRCEHLIIILVTTTVIITAGCVLVMAEEFPILPKCLRKSSSTLVHDRNRRTIFVCASVILLSVASSMGIFCYCADGKCMIPANASLIREARSIKSLFPEISNFQLDLFLNESESENIKIVEEIVDKTEAMDDGKGVDKFIQNLVGSETVTPQVIRKSINLNETTNFMDNKDEQEPACDEDPEYIVFTWVLCLVALATALKLYYLVKTCMALFMVVIFCIIILETPQLFDKVEDAVSGMRLSSIMIILLLVFLTMVIYHARLVEVTARLDFIWKEQAQKELTNMKANRLLNDTLIKNILPEHVAAYYLVHETSDDLYSNMHSLCGVMFASIPNFKDFYSEDIENGKACIRILNEIICDFDSLLDEPRFATVEKIKTVGATYMAASGLNPKHRVEIPFPNITVLPY